MSDHNNTDDFNVKDFLNQVRQDQSKLDETLSTLAILQHSNTANPEEIEELSRLVRIRKAFLATSKAQVEWLINQIEFPTLRKILFLRYFRLFKWKEIETIIHYSRRHLYKLHAEALKEAEIIYEREMSDE